MFKVVFDFVISLLLLNIQLHNFVYLPKNSLPTISKNLKKNVYNIFIIFIIEITVTKYYNY